MPALFRHPHRNGACGIPARPSIAKIAGHTASSVCDGLLSDLVAQHGGRGGRVWDLICARSPSLTVSRASTPHTENDCPRHQFGLSRLLPTRKLFLRVPVSPRPRSSTPTVTLRCTIRTVPSAASTVPERGRGLIVVLQPTQTISAPSNAIVELHFCHTGWASHSSGRP